MCCGNVNVVHDRTELRCAQMNELVLVLSFFLFPVFMGRTTVTMGSYLRSSGAIARQRLIWNRSCGRDSPLPCASPQNKICSSYKASFPGRARIDTCSRIWTYNSRSPEQIRITPLLWARARLLPSYQKRNAICCGWCTSAKRILRKLV